MPLDIPKFKDNKRTYLAVGGVAAAFVAFRWYQARSNAATDAATPTDTTMGTGSVTDVPGGSYGPGNVQYGGADITTPSATPATNAEWTALAVQALINTGYDGATVQAALGRYLTDQTLTTEQETIVRAAIAVAGNPPVGTHTITHMPSTAPNIPKTSPTKLAVSVLKVGGKSPTKASLHWTSVPGAKEYHLHKNGANILNTTGGSATVTRPGTYYVSAIPRDAAANTGSVSNTVSI